MSTRLGSTDTVKVRQIILKILKLRLKSNSSNDRKNRKVKVLVSILFFLKKTAEPKKENIRPMKVDFMFPRQRPQEQFHYSL